MLALVDDTLAFVNIYRRHFSHVCRWLRAHGIPDSDREDVAQEVFLVVERRLPRFEGGAGDARALRAWLYEIVVRTASDHRRRAWWKNLFARRRDTAVDERSATDPDPAELLDRKERSAQLHRLLARLSEKRRTTLALFEIEGFTCEEIADFQGIPAATVRTRLHHARKELFALVSKLSLETPPPPRGGTP